MANCYCIKCQRTFDEKNFYQYKNGTKCDFCKACLTMHVKPLEADTFLWILEKFDVPYVEAEWRSLYEKAYQKDPYKVSGAAILGKYLSKMRLNQWKKMGWADTERLKKEQAERDQLYGTTEEQLAEKRAEMQKAFEEGIISEAQWMTYQQQDRHAEPQFQTIDGAVTTTLNGFPAPVSSAFVSVDIPDIGEQLTDEDKIYLATKWGTSYTAANWVYLENLYNEYSASFDLHNADLSAGTKRLCKLLLRADEALDCGDAESHAKYERSADTLRKSLKFTEAQRKDDKVADFSCYGVLVDYCEKTEGGIPPHKIEAPRDMVDVDLNDIKEYNQSLIKSDPAVVKMIEEYIKKREALLQQQEDEKNDTTDITDEDLYKFRVYEEQLEDLDAEGEDDE